jgi:hypothetical protein
MAGEPIPGSNRFVIDIGKARIRPAQVNPIGNTKVDTSNSKNACVNTQTMSAGTVLMHEQLLRPV